MKKFYIVKNITQFNKFNDIRNQVRKELEVGTYPLTDRVSY